MMEAGFDDREYIRSVIFAGSACDTSGPFQLIGPLMLTERL